MWAVNWPPTSVSALGSGKCIWFMGCIERYRNIASLYHYSPKIPSRTRTMASNNICKYQITWQALAIVSWSNPRNWIKPEYHKLWITWVYQPIPHILSARCQQLCSFAVRCPQCYCLKYWPVLFFGWCPEWAPLVPDLTSELQTFTKAFATFQTFFHLYNQTN